MYRREEECERKGREVGERSTRGKRRVQSREEHRLHTSAQILVAVRLGFESQLKHVVAV